MTARARIEQLLEELPEATHPEVLAFLENLCAKHSSPDNDPAREPEMTPALMQELEDAAASIERGEGIPWPRVQERMNQRIAGARRT